MKNLLSCSALALLLAGCSSVDSGLTMLTSTVQSISGLSGSIGKFTSMLNGVPGLDQLKQLAGFSDQAGGLQKKLADAAGAAPESAKSGVASVQDLLGKLGGSSFKLDSLKSLAPEALTKKIGEFTGLGSSLGKSATDLLGMLK